MFSPPLRCALCVNCPSLRSVKVNAFSSSSSSHECQPWIGLQSWRESPLNNNRRWGSNGPEQASIRQTDYDNVIASASSLSELGTLVLSTSGPLTKCELSHLAYTRWCREYLPLGVSTPPDHPARPPKPNLVSPKEVPAPKKSGLPLNAYMLYNLAHVDTVVRFSQYSDVLGDGFSADFAHVAYNESRYFSWCAQRLAELGVRECEKSSEDAAACLAIILLVQEARGFDAGPRLVQKLIGFGDRRTSNIVARIADEEVAHVAVGVFWFILVCKKLGRVPCDSFKDLLKEYNVEVKGPFNYSAREEAGIPRHWYDGSSMDLLDKSKQLSEACGHHSYGEREFKFE